MYISYIYISYMYIYIYIYIYTYMYHICTMIPSVVWEHRQRDAKPSSGPPHQLMAGSRPRFLCSIYV